MKLSIIIPFYNSADTLSRCLEALKTSTLVPDEVIVVDDSSTDESSHITCQLNARLLRLTDGPKGPAAARNRGAEVACGDILVFVDADIVVHSQTFEKINEIMVVHPDLAAVFGSYDDHPVHRGMISLYKNLQHHYVHHHSRREASTFWAGCGAIRRTVFFELGGFDESYRRPSIEDIELGFRMTRAGYQILLCTEVRVTHLKKWTLSSWLHSDILDRAIPWTRLIHSTSHLPSALNLDWKSRMSAMTAWLSIGFFLAGLWFPRAWVGMLFSLTALGLLNFGLYRLFYRKGGLLFAALSFCLHIIYYLYSSLTFFVLLVWYRLMGKAKQRPKSFTGLKRISE